MDKNGIEDIKMYPYLRFCCLLDFFDVTIKELCIEYELEKGYKNTDEKDYDETSAVQASIDYFKHHLSKRQRCHKALRGYIKAFLFILEEKNFDTFPLTRGLFEKARKDILSDKDYKIIFDYKQFYDFFSHLIDYMEEYIPADLKVEHPLIGVHPKTEIYHKSIMIFMEEHVNFNGEMLKEIYKKELSLVALEIENIPIYQLYSNEDWHELYEICPMLCHNWDFFEKICADHDLAATLIELLRSDNIDKKQNNLLEKASKLNGRKILDNATNYAYILHFNGSKRISASKISKFIDDTILKTACGEFCVNHKEEIKKLDSQICETLFYYACVTK